MLSLSYLLSLALTIIIELLVAVMLKFREKPVLFAVVLVNLVTHPILNYLLLLNYNFWNLSVPLVTIVLEVAVIGVEYMLLKFALRRSGMLKLSIAMNVTSFILGLVLSVAGII